MENRRRCKGLARGGWRRRTSSTARCGTLKACGSPPVRVLDAVRGGFVEHETALWLRGRRPVIEQRARLVNNNPDY
jgi:hypothetical protein